MRDLHMRLCGRHSLEFCNLRHFSIRVCDGSFIWIEKFFVVRVVLLEILVSKFIFEHGWLDGHLGDEVEDAHFIPISHLVSQFYTYKQSLVSKTASWVTNLLLCLSLVSSVKFRELAYFFKACSCSYLYTLYI